jgi:hypothetical protein
LTRFVFGWIRIKNVLGAQLKVAGVVALEQLLRFVSVGPVDHLPALDRFPLADFIDPADQVGVGVCLEELRR